MNTSKDANQIDHIVIVGGGTAGWLAANHLAKNLITGRSDSIKITLIESPNIPTIGVGEGTVPMMRQSLQHLGISETEFIRECDATFKQGIKFVNWTHNPEPNSDDYYHHIFDYPNITELDLTPYWLKKQNSAKQDTQSYVDAVSIQGEMCDTGLAPKSITSPEFEGAVAYAYHLDASKFSQILTNNAVNKLGVNHVLAEVKEITQHESGEIRSVVTDSHGEIFADFFVDCTGFKSLLIGEKLGVGFKDKSDVLFVDHAVVMQVPYENETTEIPCHTISTALDSGWVWDIGLKQRRGIGHVYSSKYISHEEAEKQLREYVGSAAEGVDSRVISMNIGYREKFWHKNCVALGLAQGFVEPLEATGLLVFDATAKMLAEQFPTSKLDMSLIEKQFNERVSQSWDNVIDFVKMHYCLSKRDDSQFWKDNTDEKSIPASLKERLARWKHQPPSPYDFTSKLSIFNLENYLYVLYGMEFSTEIENLSRRLTDDDKADEIFSHIEAQKKVAQQRLPKHRELIEKIHEHGMQKR